MKSWHWDELSLKQLLWRYGLLAFVLAALFWSLWSLLGIDSSILPYVQPDWAKVFEASDPWTIYNPWLLSRWYDLLFFPAWVILLVTIAYLTQKNYGQMAGLNIAFMMGMFPFLILAWPLLVIFVIGSIAALLNGTIGNFYGDIFTIHNIELVFYIFCFFFLSVLLFGAPIYFGFAISFLYGVTFGFAAGLKVFIFYFAPFYATYYLIKFIVVKLNTGLKKRKKPVPKPR